MKNKILIGVAILLVVFLIAVRYLFNEKFETFKTSVAQFETAQLESFRKAKESNVDSLSNGDKKIVQLFTEQFDENKAMKERDTSFSFLYLDGSVKYKISSLQYIDCLNNKCLIDLQNDTNQKLIRIKEIEFEKKYGKTFALWYPKLKEEKLLKKTDKSGDCSIFFPNLYEISYDANAWNDFGKFLHTYNLEVNTVQIQNKRIEREYESQVASTRNQLRSNVLGYFDNELLNRKSQILSIDTAQKTFDSPILGIITYNLGKTSFNNVAFQNVADDAFAEQWKSNSLNTGAMPYSYCYGSSNYCGSNDCSKIAVTTGGSDVLVTIKDINGNVVRHAYINAGYTFTFSVPDGQYQVFFYAGSGWNPNKFMTTTSCGTLRGGFVSGENFTKDNYITVYNQIMTYTLISQVNGNLNTKPSSMDEAFK